MLWGSGEAIAISSPSATMAIPMTRRFDVRKSDRPFDQNRTLVAVIEPSQTSWLVGGIVPGLKRSALKKPKPEQEQLFKPLVRWLDEAVTAGHEIMRTRGWRARALATGSGRRAGSRHEALKPMSFMRRALPFRASTAVPRPAGSIPNC